MKKEKSANNGVGDHSGLGRAPRKYSISIVQEIEHQNNTNGNKLEFFI